MRIRLVMVLTLLGLLVGASGLVSADAVDGDGTHHGDSGHMWDWWGMPFMGFWMIGLWIVFIAIAFLVYFDAQKRGMNGIVWFVLVILPWIGIAFLIAYLVVRKDKVYTKPPRRFVADILEERYARGEITREEFQRMKNDIGN